MSEVVAWINGSLKPAATQLERQNVQWLGANGHGRLLKQATRNYVEFLLKRGQANAEAMFAQYMSEVPSVAS